MHDEPERPVPARGAELRGHRDYPSVHALVDVCDERVQLLRAQGLAVVRRHDVRGVALGDLLARVDDRLADRARRRQPLERPCRGSGRSAPVVPAAASVWQAPQAVAPVERVAGGEELLAVDGWRRAAAAAAPPAAAAAGRLRRDPRGVGGGRRATLTNWRMKACPRPHSSAQTTWKRPVLVGVSEYSVVMPGTASTFSRHSGTQKSWMTSLEWTLNWTGSPTGSTSRLDLIGLPPSLRLRTSRRTAGR